MFVAIGLWAVARALVSTTWRDPVVVGGLNAGGLIALGIAAGCALELVLTMRRRGPASEAPDADRWAEVGWADPGTRPPS
jgi:hypothetical protein